jgi:2-polyprenyl-3-methyl-5-hydroxy-6-metoxy-1,4-benzoquinol methylase
MAPSKLMTSQTDNFCRSASMERIVPDELNQSETTGAETLKLHMERYEFARRNLVPGTVLDLACGVGYGTAVLSVSPSATKVIGVDISEDAVRYATERYRSERTAFVCAPALKFTQEGGFDNVVSLETIEHVDDPYRLFAHLVSLLKTGGRLTASVPVTPSVDANPHHRSNFTARKFMQMGEKFSLRRIETFSQVQPYSPSSILLRRERRTENLRRSIPMFYLYHPSHFFLRIWSLVQDGFANKYVTVVWER